MKKQISLVFLFMVTLAHAAAIEWGEVKAMGSACRGQGVRQRGNDQNLHLDFGSFQVRGEQERETCLIALPVEWPKGKALVLKNLRYSGKSRGDSTRLAVEFHTPGRRGVPVAVSPSKGAFDDTRSGEIFRSGCDGKALLRVNSSLTVERGELSIDTLGADVALESCQ